MSKKNLLTSLSFTIFSFVFILIARPVCASSYSDADLAIVQKGLGSVSTLKASIKQVDSSGMISNGFFYLKKPGKIRMDLKSSDSDFSVLGNGKQMIYRDNEEDEIAEIPSTEIPFEILMSGNVDTKNISIESIKKDKDTISMTFWLKNKKDNGIFTFIFRTGDDFRIKEIYSYSDETKKQKISLFFSDVKKNEPINDSLFHIEK